VKLLQTVLMEAGISKSVSKLAVAGLLRAIEDELATQGKFTLRGIGNLEMVPNKRQQGGALRIGAGGLGGRIDRRVPQAHVLPVLPVRVRFTTSRELLKKIARAHAHKTA
jgi:Bacterial DNA-binding protein